MRNLKLVLEYIGAEYAGFQRQPRSSTIQEELEKALRTVLREEVRVKGSGRTDARVHALKQAANFFTSSRISLKRLQHSLNAILPDDIVVVSLEEVDLSFDARRDVRYREYQYFILNRSYPSVFFRSFSHLIVQPLDVEAMNKAAGHLKGKHDFSAFCASISQSKGCIRTVLKAKVERKGDFVVITLRAHAFVHHMVRNIAGTLIKIGLGEWPPKKVKELLEGKDRTKAGPTAPAKGLFLTEVKY